MFVTEVCYCSVVKFVVQFVSISLQPCVLLPASLLHSWGFSRQEILEWVAISFSMSLKKRKLLLTICNFKITSNINPNDAMKLN